MRLTQETDEESEAQTGKPRLALNWEFSCLSFPGRSSFFKLYTLVPRATRLYGVEESKIQAIITGLTA